MPTTYTNAINRLSKKLRDTEAWPDDDSKESEQIHLLYVAALAVMKEHPQQKLDMQESNGLAKVRNIVGSMDMFSLPSDGFYARPDAGIAFFLIDDVPYFIFQSMSYDSVAELADMRLHNCQTYFAIDIQSRHVFVTSAQEVKVYYAPIPDAPNSPSSEYPLQEGGDFERACSIVAAHVSGETIRDSAASAFESLLADIYRDPTPAQPQDDE